MTDKFHTIEMRQSIDLVKLNIHLARFNGGQCHEAR